MIHPQDSSEDRRHVNPAELSAAFFLQMAVVLGACRAVGVLARWVGQPQVVGEMVAGVLLGPSLFGLLLSDVQQQLFPPDSLKVLFVGAQLGVALYMFLVGLEFRTDLFRGNARSAATVSAAGMLVPFALGALLAIWFVRAPGLFADRATTLDAVLFMGAAMSITAFPMLARIIFEHGLTGTRLGTLALAAGSIDDAIAWCVLAIVLATFGGDQAAATRAILGGGAYALVVLTVGRVVLRPLGAATARTGRLSTPRLAATLGLFLLAAWVTERVGIHAVFGGFLLGIAMPRGPFARELHRQLEPITVALFLPMFFTFSGLNTRLDVLTSGSLLLVAGAVLLAACLGKGGACWAAARLNGEDNRTALAVGALMNARGLMELIILNIGLQAGIVRPELFSVMVLMAIVTTLLASPLFERAYGRQARADALLDSKGPTMPRP